MSFSHFFLKVG